MADMIKSYIIKSDCGCEFEASPTGQIFRWCPLHKSAPDILEKLKLSHNMLLCQVPVYSKTNLYIQIEEILAKVETKEKKAEFPTYCELCRRTNGKHDEGCPNSP